MYICVLDLFNLTDMKIYFTILLFVFLTVRSLGQTQVIFNDTLYPFEYGQHDFYHVFEHDSCYYIEGYKTLSRDFKFFIKTKKDGTVIKKKQYDPNLIGFGGRFSNSIIQTDSGFVCASTIYDTVYHYKSVIMAIDFNLDTVWTKTYPYTQFSNHFVHNCLDDIKRTWEGGYIVTGHYFDSLYSCPSHPFLMKIDRYGTIQWYKDYQSLGHCIFTKIEICPDHGIIILANKDTPSIIKTDALGAILWESPLLSTSTYFENSDLVYVGNNEYFMATNYVYSYFQNNPLLGIHLCRINSNTGQFILDTNYNPFPTFIWYPKMHLHLLGNNRILVSATAHAPDSLGIDYGGQGVMLLYNLNGDSIGYDRINFGNITNSETWLLNLLVDDEGNFIGVGQYSTNMAFPAWYFKKSSSVLLSANKSYENNQSNELLIFPNPGMDYCFVKSPITNPDEIIIYDLQAKIVFNQRNLQSNEGLVKLNIKGLNPGTYIVKVNGINKNYIGKITIQ